MYENLGSVPRTTKTKTKIKTKTQNLRGNVAGH